MRTRAYSTAAGATAPQRQTRACSATVVVTAAAAATVAAHGTSIHLAQPVSKACLRRPPFDPGIFGIPDPDSATKGISTQWQRYIDNNPTNAKTVFCPGEKVKLARLQRLGR